MELTQKIRKPAVAGAFYSGDKMILERDISMLLEASPVLDLPRSIKTIVSPHAGYMYSGGVAARAYRQLLDAKYEWVIVVSPSHRDAFSYNSVYAGKGYLTPLGEIPVDQQKVEQLAQTHSDIRISESGHESMEHSLEVQLPFLQWTLNKFKLIPVMMGLQNEDQSEILANGITEVFPPEKTLVVASSDLSHFYPDEQARKLDQNVRENIENFDEEGLWKDVVDRRVEMCGFGPVITGMKTAKSFGAEDVNVLLYRNSGDVTGDRNEVVGYLSAVFY